MFDWNVISNCGTYAYCIGTKAQCLRYQLQHGVRTTTQLYYFPTPANK